MQPGYWKYGSWRKIPLFFHWSLLLWLPWYWWAYKSVIWAVLTFAAFLTLLLAHEIGHAIVAKSRHIEVDAIKLFVLHGQCEYETPYYEKDDLLIAWGGILAQLCILSVALVAIFLSKALLPQIAYILAPIFFVFIPTNIVLCAVNLLPISPLDGHKAWRAIPYLWLMMLPKFASATRPLYQTLNFKRRRILEKKSRLAAAEIIERLKK